MRLESLCTIFALAAICDLHIIQFDITSAYLHGTLKEEVYVKQPEGYVVPGKSIGCGALRRGSTGWYKPGERGTRSGTPT
jgi:Reverse transcriptase (RNA-dependent DNA polymerase)